MDRADILQNFQTDLIPILIQVAFLTRGLLICQSLHFPSHPFSYLFHSQAGGEFWRGSTS